MKNSLLWLLPIALAGCATAPRPLQGEFAQVGPREAASAEGARVRWGGNIIAVAPRAGETCFEVLGRALNISARPLRTDTSDGRFLACRSGFYDPEVFKAGREVTVVGTVAGSEVRKVGEFDYAYPRLVADAVYLWPERSEYIEAYPSPFFYHSPYWHGFGHPGFYRHPYRWR